MTIPTSIQKLVRGGVVAGCCIGTATLARAAAPAAVSDNLIGSPVTQNQTRSIAEAILIANDLGDGKAIKSAANSASGAAVTWNNSTKIITYDPRTVPAFIALAAGDSVIDTFTYVLQGTDGPDSTGIVTMLVTGVNDPPSISGIPASILSITDKQKTSTPFAGLAISDPDTGDQLTVIVTLSPSANGSFSNTTGFVDSGAGSITFTGSAAEATSKVAALVFVPTENRIAPGTSDDTLLSVSVNDGTAPAVNASRTVRTLSVNDAPVLSPGTAGPFAVASGASVSPFSGITLDDVDFDPGATSGGIGGTSGTSFTATITLSATPALDPPTYGGIISPDFLPGTTANTYTFTGSRSDVQAAINAALYIAPASGGTFQIALSVADAGASSHTVTAAVTVSQPNPGMSGLVAGQELADNGVIFPFASTSFNNFGAGNRVVEIRLDSDAKGAFDILGQFAKVTESGAEVYRMSGNSVTATDAVRGLRFRPTPNRITGASETVTFTVLILAGGDPALNKTDSLVVTVLPSNDAPAISGINPDIRINDDQTARPFATMTVTDPDAGGTQPVTVTVLLSGEFPSTNAPRAGGGTLAQGPDAVPGVTFATTGTPPNVVHTLTGTPAGVTVALRALVFSPTIGRNAVGERETVRFTLLADDGNGGTAQNTSSTVIVTSVNGAPRILGVPLPSQQPFAVPASGNNMALPFAALEVADKDDLTLTITLDNLAKGTLSTGAFTSPSAGTYAMTGTPADVTTALKALVFTLNAGFDVTTFTLTASDTVNTTVATLAILIRERNVAHIVTSTADSGAGSLREAIDLAGNGDMIVFDFPADAFPVTIALDLPLSISKNLHIIGSGVSQLSLSGQATTGLFSVVNSARLTLEQLTLKDGNAGSYGGAVSVESGGALIARHCEFTGNSAGQFGGAIDVFDGELIVENCLFFRNSVTGSIAEAGGAISLYTSLPCSITNCTFVENRQDNGGGEGGAAVYAQNADLADFSNLRVDHCTFLGNADARLKGSAILSASTGMKVHVRNNIFEDQQGVVLDVLGGGRFNSLGGNIATDETLTTYTLSSQNVTLLDHGSDKRSRPPMLNPPSFNGGATRTSPPKAGSLPIDAAVPVDPASETTGTDQRGVWRTAAARDIGAFEAGVFKRVNINEIFVAAGAGADFIEFYNPRDSETLDMKDLTLWVDGTLVHTFATQMLAPGSGFAWMSTVDLNAEKGLIELRNASGQTVLRVDYMATFAEQGVELPATAESITRYPRYEGGFLPHRRVVERITGIPGGNPTSPGDDVDGSALGGGNAPPIAVADVDASLSPVYQVFANQTLIPDVLANDIEFDRTDTIKITEVMPLTAGTVQNAELFAINGVGTIALAKLPPGVDTTIRPDGASLTIQPDRLGLTYDPRSSPTMIALSKGETATDIWAYTLLDHDPAGAPQSRGADPAKQAENLIKATNYLVVTVTGINEAPLAADDSAATRENQAIRLLADADLLAPAIFDFEDQAADFMDFDAMGNPVALRPLPPTVSLLANDDDVDHDDSNTTLLLSAVHTTAAAADTLVATSALGATVTLDIRAERRETSILYDPRSSAILNALSDGEIATDTFHYSILDRHGDRGVAKVTITVTGVNDVPMAMDDQGFVANEDSPLPIAGADLLRNDVDPDRDEADPDDVLTIVSPFATRSTLGASLAFNGTTINYDPRSIPGFEALARNETIIDTFTYSIADARGGTSQATVSVVVEGRNDAPVAANDLLQLLENQTREVAATAGLLANDRDVDINGTPPDDDPWVLPQRNVTTPLGANLNIEPDGSFRYDANSPAIDSLRQGQLAVELFPYTLIDNSRTTASDDAFKVLADRQEVLLPVLLNDAVVGSVATPIAGYSAEAGSGRLVVTSPNHALRDGLLLRIEGHGGAGTYNGLHAVTSLGRDQFRLDVPFADDPVGARGTWRPWFAITSVSPGDQGGSLTVTGGAELRYTPADGFRGIERFTYTIEDGAGGQDVGKVAVEVILPGVNGLLSASNDRFRVGMGGSGVVIDVLANDGIRPSSGPAPVIVSTSPVGGAAGTLAITDGGTRLAYTPDDPAFTGVESFTYRISGGGVETAQATVVFEVVDRTGQLHGSEDDFFVVVGSSGNLLDVLANDPSLPASPVVSTLLTVAGSPAGGATPSGGSVQIVGNQLSYTPPAAILTDTFTYTARDPSGATTAGTVRVRVVTAASNFFAINDHYTVVAGAGPVQLPVLLNDGTVPGGTALTVVNLGLDTDAPPEASRVAITGGTSVRYTPPAGATTEVFNYEISTGTLERREGVITVTVVDRLRTPPEAENDAFHVAKNSGAVTLDVLKNDVPYPAAGWASTISASTQPAHGGTVAITGEGAALSYIPAPGFFGTESFTYTIRDLAGATSTATVTVRVGAMLTAPDAFTVLQGSAANALRVLANDDLLDGASHDYRISAVSPASTAGGTVTLSPPGPDNHPLYTPRPGFAGTDAFTYTVVDRSGGTLTETVNVTVLATASDRSQAVLRVEITGVNDLPILTGLANAAITDKQMVNPFATVSITDLDEGGNQLQTVVVSFNAALGTIVAPGMTQLSPGTYRRTATPAEVTASLRAIVFTPFENRIDYINPGQADAVFNLTVTDGYIPTPIQAAATVTITPINDPPFIADPIPNLTLPMNAFARAIYLPQHFADVDDDLLGGQVIWTVTGNTNPTLFESVTIDPTTRLLALRFATDQTGVSDITVRGTDRGGLFVETTFRVTLEGPPVLVLAAGQTRPPAPTFVAGSQVGFRRDYRHSFRISNPGTLPVDSFIINVGDLHVPVDGIIISAATFSTNENGTPANFADDTVSAAGVTILRKSASISAVKYDVTIPPGSSLVVHLTYQGSSISLIPIQPAIHISLSTPLIMADAGLGRITPGIGRDLILTFQLAAGRSHRLEFSADLKTWSPWATPIPVSDFPRTIQFVDDGLNTGRHPAEAPTRFYRLVRLSAP